MPHYAAVAFLRERFFFQTRLLHQISLTNIHCAYLDSEQITRLLLELVMQMYGRLHAKNTVINNHCLSKQCYLHLLKFSKQSA